METYNYDVMDCGAPGDPCVSVAVDVVAGRAVEATARGAFLQYEAEEREFKLTIHGSHGAPTLLLREFPPDMVPSLVGQSTIHVDILDEMDIVGTFSVGLGPMWMDYDED